MDTPVEETTGTAIAPPPPAQRTSGRLRRRGRAQSMVEFALITPLLFTLVLGIMEFGWLFYNHMVVHYATREGARIASAAGKDNLADDWIRNVVSSTVQTLPYDDLVSLRIYHTATDGTCADSPCKENVYTRTAAGWSAASPNTWPSGTRRTQEPTDAIAVQIRYTHRFLVNFLPGANGSVQLNDYSVLLIEPENFRGTPIPAGPQP